MKFLPVVMLSVAAIFATGCADDSSSAGSSAAQVANPPSAIVQDGIVKLGAVRFRLSAPDTATFVTVALASLGVSQPDRACAAPLVTTYLRPAADGSVDLDRIGLLVTRVNQDTTIGKAVTKCLSPESAARRTAKQPSPDRDVSGILAIAHQVGIGESLAVGLTNEEARCYSDTLLKDLDPAAYASSIVGIAPPSMDSANRIKPVAVLEKCLTVDRLYQLKSSIEGELTVLDKCKQENRDANSAILDEQLKHINDPTTTTTPGTATTPSSTLKPCQ